MERPINVLLIEDSEADAKLILLALRRGGFAPNFLQVQDAQALTNALLQHWDVVISDFQMHNFNGMDALRLCQANGSDIPFILVSGTIGEDIAVEAMRAGANDYLLKSNLVRLGPALKRELQEAARRAEHRTTVNKLAESERRFNAFMDASPMIAWIKDDSGRHLYMNQGWNKAFKLRCEGWRGMSEFEPVPDMLGQITKNDLEVLESGQPLEVIEKIIGPGQDESYWKSVIFPFLGAAQQRLVGGFSINITKEKQAEETIHNLAYLDPLTLLPNRRAMLDHLKHALAASVRSKRHGALLLIDLDNFKTLNDTRGHDVGDLLLQQISQRLARCVREGDTVSRIGGDEFVVILESLDKVPEAAAFQAEGIGNKILAAVNETYFLPGAEHNGTASIGITLFVDRQNSIEDLMKRADLAMYRAKASGRNALLFFNPAMEAAVRARASLEADLRQGLLKGHFLLYYQAQVNSHGDLTGVEALLRLQHPQRGLVLPTSFIPLAEETGLILELGYWVLKTACIQLAVWATRPETSHMTLAVNVSSRQFRHPDFIMQVLAIMQQTGANPRRLKLELTEGVMLDDIQTTIEKMDVLKATGVNFSLDDFGTGYSSLNYLKRLPLYQLKIDQSFVRDVLDDPNDAAIVCAIVALGQSLGLEIIAEGVETVGQRDFLADHGCANYQGFLYGHPGPVESLH